MSFLRNTTVWVRGNCHYRQPRNNSRDRTDVNRRKCGRYTRDLQNFDRPLVVWSMPAMFLTSATCHLFEKRWRESEITAVAVSHGACRHRLHFAISRHISNFARSFRRLSCVAASRISHFALYQHPPPDGPARRTSHGHLQP